MSDFVTAAPPGAVAGFDATIGMPASLSLAPIGNPTLLALDSAGHACSVAVWRDGTLMAHHFAEMARGHGERLLPMAAETMKAASIEMSALDAIVVTVGPGSFTGLRIGLAAARGLGLALRRPVIGITSFLAVAAALPAALRKGREILVALDTKRDDFFLQRFDQALHEVGPARLVSASELMLHLPAGPLLLAGDGVPLLAPLLPRSHDIALAPGPGHAEAALFISFVARLLVQGSDATTAALLAPDPFYLRAPDVKLPSGSSVDLKLP